MTKAGAPAARGETGTRAEAGSARDAARAVSTLLRLAGGSGCRYADPLTTLPVSTSTTIHARGAGGWAAAGRAPRPAPAPARATARARAARTGRRIRTRLRNGGGHVVDARGERGHVV